MICLRSFSLKDEAVFVRVLHRPTAQNQRYLVLLVILMQPCCEYLSKAFLPIVLEVFWIDIKVVFIDGEWLGTLSNIGHKLLHFQKSTALPVSFKVPHRDVGGSDTIYRKE